VTLHSDLVLRRRPKNYTAPDLLLMDEFVFHGMNVMRKKDDTVTHSVGGLKNNIETA
jgi:hypothetical protein